MGRVSLLIFLAKAAHTPSRIVMPLNATENIPNIISIIIYLAM